MKSSKSAAHVKYYGWISAVVLFLVMVVFFGKSFLPNWILFSNDGPLGVQNSEWVSLPRAFLGQWYDLNSLGINAAASMADFSSLVRWVLGPVGYAKFIIPIGLWFLGIAAYFFFRRSGMSIAASILGGLVASLTTGYFSNACWGAAPPIIAFGMDFLALAALTKRDKFPFWIAPALGGLAVGINVMEAADIGALFSLLVAAFAMYQSLIDDSVPLATLAIRGVIRTAIVTVFAGFIAAYAVSVLVGANIRGIHGTQQNEQAKSAQWDFATQWSMPKRETLALVVPNLYGCSVITPGAANYWGGLGTDPEWDRYFAGHEQGQPPPPGHFIRHTGRGIYLGVFVVLVGLWAALQSFRSRDSVFTPLERKLIWFWFVVGIVALLFAWGRYAPFYRLIYTLPYFSTIRNPDKFLHFVTFASIILFGYGINGLYRRYIDVPLVGASNGRLKAWWTKASNFDRRWVVGCVAFVILALVAWAVYASQRGAVENYLVELQRLDALRNGRDIDTKGAQEFAASQLSFSLQQVGWCVLFLTLGCGLMLMIFVGTFAGRRARWVGILLGIIVVADLGRANLPYIIFWNYKEKYEVGNPEPIIKFLATKRYEHRVAYVLPSPLPTPDPCAPFHELYGLEWTQQLFPFYNIQTLDIVQMPRMPEDLVAFNTALQIGIKQDGQGHLSLDPDTFYRLARLWELTGTRYLVGPAIFQAGNSYAPLDALLNAQFDPAKQRFRVLQRFKLGPRPGVEAAVQYSQIEGVPSDDPEKAIYALFEFTGALPRANLFSNWEIVTNDQATLDKLASQSFDPAKTVLLPKPLPGDAKPSGTNENSGTVKFTSYEPADIKLDATASSPSVLMLCDKYDPDWQVWVDGKRGEVLSCDYLMRGVFLDAGHHDVEFKFRPNINMFYVNIGAILVGACLLGYAIVASRKAEDAEDSEKVNSK